MRIGDDAFYYLHEEGELQHVVLTHVDDLILARTFEFMRNLVQKLWMFGLCQRLKGISLDLLDGTLISKRIKYGSLLKIMLRVSRK